MIGTRCRTNKVSEAFYFPQSVSSDEVVNLLWLVGDQLKSAGGGHFVRFFHIVKHRQEFYHMGGIDYNLHQPQTLNPLPTPEFMDAWETDYRLMQERMIYGDSPPFQAVIDGIKKFTEEEINQLDWRMDAKFPKPE
jgi:hypothetical protein